MSDLGSVERMAWWCTVLWVSNVVSSMSSNPKWCTMMHTLGIQSYSQMMSCWGVQSPKRNASLGQSDWFEGQRDANFSSPPGWDDMPWKVSTLPPAIIMEVKNGCISNRIVNFQIVRNVPLNHDYGRKSRVFLPLVGSQMIFVCNESLKSFTRRSNIEPPKLMGL